MKIQHWPQYWAAQVLKRDRGVCQLCGFDNGVTERVLHHLKWDDVHNHYADKEHAAAWHLYRHVLIGVGFRLDSSFVEADHIVPLIEGGANTLENGRTLCVPCHKRETARLARDRGLTRRQKGTLFEHMGERDAISTR